MIASTLAGDWVQTWAPVLISGCGMAIAGALWKLSGTISRLDTTLQDHDRRIELLEDGNRHSLGPSSI